MTNQLAVKLTNQLAVKLTNQLAVKLTNQLAVKLTLGWCLTWLQNKGQNKMTGNVLYQHFPVSFIVYTNVRGISVN